MVLVMTLVSLSLLTVLFALIRLSESPLERGGWSNRCDGLRPTPLRNRDESRRGLVEVG